MSVHFSSQPAPEPLSQISDTARVSKQRRTYRPARPLPYELQQHCIAFVGEELCTVVDPFFLRNLLIFQRFPGLLVIIKSSPRWY